MNGLARRSLAALEWLLVLPAALFMAAIFLRNVQPPPYQPAEAARWVVGWFSARPILGLDVLLCAMPLACLVIGCVAAARRWSADAVLRRDALDMLALARAHASALLVAAATLASGCVLAIVALHMMAD